VDNEPKACEVQASKRRGGVNRLFGWGKNSYQQQVDSLGEKCADYGSLQKSAKKKRAEVEKLSTKLNNLKAERDEWLNGIRAALEEIERKGEAIQQVARLIEEHEKKHGKSLLQNQSLLQSPWPVPTAQ